MNGSSLVQTTTAFVVICQDLTPLLRFGWQTNFGPRKNDYAQRIQYAA